MQRGADGGDSGFKIGHRLQNRLRVDAGHGFAHQFALPHQQRVETNQVGERGRFESVAL